MAGTPTGETAGSTIDYGFTVMNTGNVTLDPVSVSDPLVGDVVCLETVLAPDAVTTCSATYTLTQTDVDAGHVANAATAVGAPPAGVTAPTASDSTDTPITASPAITLEKTAGNPSGETAGSTIDYEFVVTNTGNVTLDQVAVHDPLAGAVSCPDSVLAPDASTLCTATYTLTQHDVDAGSVINSATVAGTPPAGDPVTATDDTTTPLTRTATITLDKQAATPSGATAGSTIDYTFVVSNTGNVTLDPVSVDDPQAGEVVCPQTILHPGDTTSCNATYTLTQGDVDAGRVENFATATGTPPDGVTPVPTATDTTETTIEFGPTISLEKQASQPSGATAGSTIDYTFVITNTGNVTLASITLDDPLVGPVVCPSGTLAPDAAVTCTATYEITQDDVDAGLVENDATASGSPPVGPAVTATDFTVSPLPADPGVTLDKQAGTPSGNSAGDTIEYAFLVTNTGNVTLDAFVIDDPKIGPIPGDVTCPLTDLAPSESMTCAAVYPLSQADVDSGHVANTATVSTTPPFGPAITASDDTDTAIAASPAITLEKTAAAPSGNTAGSTIDFTFVVGNAGNVTLDPVDVADPTVGPVTCPTGILAPGETTICTASYTLNQADVDAGNLHNDATATGRAPSGAEVTATDSTDSPIPAAAAIILDKQAEDPSGEAAGETIAYAFVVTNSGNVTLDSISIADPLVGEVSCPEVVLAPGASTDCTATYELTQTDVDAGHVANTATASGTSPSDEVVTATDDTDSPIASAPALLLDKQAGTPTGNRAGDTLDYDFVVTNAGNVTLSSVAISDALFASVSCPDDTLAPSDSMTCSETYTLTQADVDAGTVHNEATATATTPNGGGVSADDSTDTAIAAEPAIALDKQAGPPSGNDAGSTVDYTFVVTNTGNVTLDPVGVSDPRVGSVACPELVLAPTESTTCTATYSFSQDDVDAGHFANSATATGTPPIGDEVTASDDTDTPILGSPGIALDKQAGDPTGNTAGSTIAYEFRVTNTGNLTLDPIAVDDPLVGAVACPETRLAPDEATTCTATYSLTQADVDAGSVRNQATATGTPPGGAEDVTSSDSTDSVIPPNPAITLDKQAGPPSGDRAGDTIDYTFIVANTGNVTLDPVSVTDPKVGEVSCPETLLAPGADMTCSATYAITQADVDLGEIVNNATASGTPPTGAPVSLTDSTTTPIAADPVVLLDKQAGVPTGDRAGDTIDYTFVVTNAGNVTLDRLRIDDALVESVACPVTVLAPEDSTTCTATYTLTQLDVDSGHVANSATVTATPPVGADVTATDDTDTTILGSPLLTLEKTASEPTGSPGRINAGDTIDYTFVATNRGNVTLDPVSVDDPLLGGALDCPQTSLAPDADVTCTATYELTQADVDAGQVINNATATGTPPTGPTVTAEDTTTTSIPAAPAIALDKQAGEPSGDPGSIRAGDTIDYTFLVTNLGNVTLAPVVVDDPDVGLVDCPAAALAPAEAMTCTATYTLTQIDVDRGHFTNTATVSGAPPVGADVTATDATDTIIEPAPVITLDKSAGSPSGDRAGATIDYEFVVTNAGNVTLTAVVVSDPLVGEVVCLDDVLAPGQATNCTATYALTQADFDSGHVANTAEASGTPPIGAEVSGTDSTDTALPSSPAITLEKTAGAPTGGPGDVRAGDTIDYEFLVTNTGNVTLDPISVDDPLVDEVVCPETALAPDESTTCTATYMLTQEDLNAGEVTNEATAFGTPPTDDPVTATDSTTTELPAAPAINLAKTAGEPSGDQAGSTIDYEFLVTNTGNVTLDPISIDDPLVDEVLCPETALAPEATTTCTATYTLTQEDFDGGRVTNEATVTAAPPSGDPVTATDSTTTELPANPVITLDKQAGTPTGSSAGDTIDYTFIVTNAGNVTLDPVVVEDPTVGPIDCLDSRLAPTASTTCSAAYTLTQVDVDSGHFANTATATGTPPVGDPVAGTDDTDTPILAAPAVTLEKQAGIPSGNRAGDTIDYSFVVGNPGNVTLNPFSLDDPLVGAVSCPQTVLAPAEEVTCAATYTLTQADVDAGEVVNLATASGSPPFGDSVTAEDSTTTVIEADPVITLDKQAGTPSGNAAGDTIDYTFVVGNAGNVTLDPINVADPIVGEVVCPETVLAPAEEVTCTATYTLTQADVDAGQVVNLATANGAPPFGDPVTAEDTTTTVIEADPVITLDKQAGSPSGNAAGDTIDYTFVVGNAGNVTLDPINVADPIVGQVDCPETALAPGATTTCGATYTLTQADVDAGHFANTATAAGTPPIGDDVTATDDTDTPILAEPAIALDKVAALQPNGNRSGDLIDYTFVVTNTGNVTLDPVAVDDPLVGSVTCPETTLAPDESTECSATYALTQADVDAGTVHNDATASGAPPIGDDVTATDSTDTPIESLPAIALDKIADAPSGSSAGDTIDYRFVVTNTGNVTLDPVSVDDPLVGLVSCPETTLAPDAETTCVATYALTQADVNAGRLVNVATASGTPPAGDAVTAEDTTTTDIPAEPVIALDKQAGVPTGNREGDTIDYTFLVTNAGNVTLDRIGVDDPAIGTVDCPLTVLDPAESTTCTATYPLTQLDVDAGHFANSATTSGTPPVGDDVSATDDTDTPILGEPSITLEKTAGEPTGNAAGDTIDYSFLVTNTGNVTLDQIAVDDPMVGTVSCADTTLAPDGSTTCAATYTLTQDDVDAGQVINLATVAGTPPIGDAVTAEDTTTTTIEAAPAIALDKQAGPPSGDPADVRAGATIDFAFTVTNTGNVTLEPVSVSDPLVGTVICPATRLGPAETTTCTATYVLVQADVDAGHVANLATASGTPPTGDDVSASDATDSPIEPAPAITLDKEASDPTGNRAGDTIDYTFLVANTGNVTLDPIAVDDPIIGDITCPETMLAPETSTTCEATYTLTQADVDLGHRANTATANGTPPTGDDVSATDDTDTLIDAAPAVTLEKTAADPTGNAAGDTIDYSFLVTNTGNVTLDPVTVDDPLAGEVTCPETVLAPDESTTCDATYALTQADVDAGEVVNAATASGTPPIGAAVTADDSVTTVIPAEPVIVLDKFVTALSGVEAGDQVNYSFVVTNSGNVTLASISVDDPLVDDAVDCPVAVLAPDASTTCTAIHTLTQGDVDAGQVVNQATASGTAPQGETVTADDSTTTGIPGDPSIVLDKQAGTPSGNPLDIRAGDTIDYTFVVTNTGNVTLNPVEVTDPLVAVTCPSGSLPPAVSVTCEATYELTQLDVDSGHVANTATASGTPPVGADATATDATDTPISAAPALTLDKQAGVLAANLAGATIDYTFLVTNTGNVSLDSVAVEDPVVGTVECPATDLAPSDSTTCTATYTLTQDDVDAGHVANTATASGNSPTDETVTATDETDTPIEAGAAITLDKEAGMPTGSSAGDTIDYVFTVTNSGNVTLSDVGVDDPMVGAVACPAGRLAPADTMTCTASYEITQDQVDAGEVVNTATASANPPTGDQVTSEDSTTTTIDSVPAITLEKAVSDVSGAEAGSTIDYELLVTNTGNVTLHSVSVDDPLIGAAPGVTCPERVIAPGAATTCTASYTLSQEDIDGGEVLNTAVASGTSPTDTEVTAGDSVTTPLDAAPQIVLVKRANTAGPIAAGGTVKFSFDVTNDGNVTLSGIRVEDSMLTAVTCPVTTLPPRAVTTCVGSPYTVTAADVAAGEIVNRASAFARGRGSVGETEVSAASELVIRTAAPASPAIRLDKGVADTGPYAAGQEVDYTFKVTNTGQVPLTRVAVSDSMLGKVTCRDRSLTPGDSTKCTADPYTVRTSDVRRGSVTNTATATGDYEPNARPGDPEPRAKVVADSDSARVRTTTMALLPFTGTPLPAALPLAALTMLGAGLALLVASRRRRRTGGTNV